MIYSFYKWSSVLSVKRLSLISSASSLTAKYRIVDIIITVNNPVSGITPFGVRNAIWMESTLTAIVNANKIFSQR